jgi:hypothetical protein
MNRVAHKGRAKSVFAGRLRSDTSTALEGALRHFEKSIGYARKCFVCGGLFRLRRFAAEARCFAARARIAPAFATAPTATPLLLLLLLRTAPCVRPRTQVPQPEKEQVLSRPTPLLLLLPFATAATATIAARRGFVLSKVGKYTMPPVLSEAFF